MSVSAEFSDIGKTVLIFVVEGVKERLELEGSALPDASLHPSQSSRRRKGLCPERLFRYGGC